MPTFTTLLKLALVATTALSAPTRRRDIPNAWGPIISPTWLLTYASDPGLTIIDVRPLAQYTASHIPSSINYPFSATSQWSAAAPRSGGNLTTEFAPPSQVQALLAGAGVHYPQPRPRIVIVGNTADAPRVATAIKWAGLPAGSYAVLSGGFEGWKAVGGKGTTVVPDPEAGTVVAEPDKSFVSSMADVEKAIGRRKDGVYIVDARAATLYSGESADSNAPGKLGHIESAVSLPTPEVWDEIGGFVDLDVLRARAEAAFGGTEPVEIQVYCSVGRQAATWYHLLSEVFGYKGVRLYDGSIQEWAMSHDLVLLPN